MTRRRTESRKRLRKEREAAKQRAWERIMDLPSVRGNSSGPVLLNGLTWFNRHEDQVDEVDR